MLKKQKQSKGEKNQEKKNIQKRIKETNNTSFFCHLEQEMKTLQPFWQLSRVHCKH